MAKKSDALKQEREEKIAADRNLLREEALKALHRLREIGEKLPSVDAVVVIREGRSLAEHGSR
jgi:hypothetical protein